MLNNLMDCDRSGSARQSPSSKPITVQHTASEGCGCDTMQYSKALVGIDEDLLQRRCHQAGQAGVFRACGANSLVGPSGQSAVGLRHMAPVRKLAGHRSDDSPRRHVITAHAIRRKAGRCELRPATLAGFDTLGREIITFEDATHSGRVSRLPFADGLMFLPAEIEHLPQGALVEFQPFCQR